MEDLLNHFLKLIIVFLGSGFTSLFAYWLAREVSTIPGLIFEYDKKKALEHKILISNNEKISSQSGIYEVSLPNQEAIKLFSSQKGMKKL